MTRKTSMKNIEIILAIRELQKMTSNTETPDIIKILKDASSQREDINERQKEKDLNLFFFN